MTDYTGFTSEEINVIKSMEEIAENSDGIKNLPFMIKAHAVNTFLSKAIYEITKNTGKSTGEVIAAIFENRVKIEPEPVDSEDGI